MSTTAPPSLLRVLIDSPRRTLAARKKVKITTVRASAEVQELRNSLSRELLELQESQKVYMPGLGPLPEGEDDSEEVTKLWLPSELSEDERATWCLPGIPGLEFCFRYAQADDSLSQIRRLRRLLQNVQDQNAKHLSQTQRNISCSKGIFDGLTSRVRRTAKQYRHSRQAMMVLDPSEQLSPGWKVRFRELEDADLRGPGCESYEKSEGKFQPSWIWMVPQSAGNALNNGTHPKDATPGPASTTTEDPNDPEATTTATSGPTSATTEDPEVVNSMRIHWAKCQARAERYEEEVALTVEEMGRTLRYFEWKKSRWLSLRSCREQTDSPPPIEVRRGLHAYACRQAHVYEVLIISFANWWRRVLAPHNLGSGWLHLYPIAVDPLSTGPSRGHSRQTVEPSLIPVSDLSNQPDPPSPSCLTTPPDDDEDVDPPMESDLEDNDDSGIGGSVNGGDYDYVSGVGGGADDDDDDYVSDEWEESDFED